MSMKKNRKPLILALILMGLIILGFLLVAVISWSHTASGAQRELYTPYSIDLEAIETDPSDLSAREKLLTLCEKSGEDELGTLYTSETLADYLYDCASVEKIYETDENVLIIVYMADEIGERITLSYSDDGLILKECYNEGSDTAYILKDDVAKIYENYYRGAKLF